MRKEDRFSKLPNDMIHHIFSYLDTKSAVQCSVLAKRWRTIWTSLPVLHFDDSSFEDPFLFQCFVDHVLSSRDASSSVRVLDLSCHAELDDGDIVESIIDFVTRKPVKSTIRALNILAECPVGKLPQLSLCESLTTLKLTDIAAELITLDFPTLENLFLFDCRFECPVQELFDPFRDCVNLRCLCLHGCQYYGKFDVFQIFAPRLTDLRISSMRVDEVFDSDCVIHLFTPEIRSFRYHDSDLYPFSTEGDLPLPFVEDVDINLDRLEFSERLTGDAIMPLQLIELFELMGNARIVSLSPGVIDVLLNFPNLLDDMHSPFTRMESFELNMNSPTDFVVPSNIMAYLFTGSPGFHPSE